MALKKYLNSLFLRTVSISSAPKSTVRGGAAPVFQPNFELRSPELPPELTDLTVKFAFLKHFYIPVQLPQTRSRFPFEFRKVKEERSSP